MKFLKHKINLKIIVIHSLQSFDSLDDLLFATYESILNNGTNVISKRGENREITNFSATLGNPCCRTSLSLERRLVKSKFAEFAWFLSKSDDIDYILPYISQYEFEEQDKNKIIGAYGSKIFDTNENEISQFERIVQQLTRRRETKQAFLVISESKDYKYRDEKFKSPPCTIGLHFYVRLSKLNLTCYMRSNDAYFGLPHDLFCFTMLQELISCRTSIPIGSYTHIATSMHIYNNHIKKVQNYLKEGKQEVVVMPKMEVCNDEMLQIVAAEFNSKVDSRFEELDDYWKDFALFSNKYSDSLQNEENKKAWLNMFNSPEMKRIASNSIAR